MKGQSRSRSASCSHFELMQQGLNYYYTIFDLKRKVMSSLPGILTCFILADVFYLDEIEYEC